MTTTNPIPQTAASDRPLPPLPPYFPEQSAGWAVLVPQQAGPLFEGLTAIAARLEKLAPALLDLEVVGAAEELSIIRRQLTHYNETLVLQRGRLDLHTETLAAVGHGVADTLGENRKALDAIHTTLAALVLQQGQVLRTDADARGLLAEIHASCVQLGLYERGLVTWESKLAGFLAKGGAQ